MEKLRVSIMHMYDLTIYNVENMLMLVMILIN